MTSHTFRGNIFCESIDPGWNVNLLGGGFKFQICFWIFTPEKLGGNSIQLDLRIFFRWVVQAVPWGEVWLIIPWRIHGTKGIFTHIYHKKSTRCRYFYHTYMDCMGYSWLFVFLCHHFHWFYYGFFRNPHIKKLMAWNLRKIPWDDHENHEIPAFDPGLAECPRPVLRQKATRWFVVKLGKTTPGHQVCWHGFFLIMNELSHKLRVIGDIFIPTQLKMEPENDRFFQNGGNLHVST